MPDFSKQTKHRLRLLMPLLGIALVVYLVTKVDSSSLVASAKAVGWGIFLVIALAGVSHLIKTWAWRLALHGEASKVSFARTLGLRLISEAIGQFGFLGMIVGDTSRVAWLGADVPVAYAISSVTLDRCLFIMTGAIVTILGILAALITVSLSHALQLYASILVMALCGLLLAAVFAVRQRWPLFSATAGAVTRIPRFQHWFQGKRSMLISAEGQIANFHREQPGAFWSSVILNLVSHLLAIGEVYLILRLLGVPIGLLAALILESLTKLINVIGAINPGNLGTYEGGNMAICKLVHLTGTEGLALALCRRLRAIFWALIGALCLIWFSQSTRKSKSHIRSGIDRTISPMPFCATDQSILRTETAFILACNVVEQKQCQALLAQVGTLPVLLRAILGVQHKCQLRTIIVLNSDTGPAIKAALQATKRLPDGIEWMLVPAGTSYTAILRKVNAGCGRVVFTAGDRTYHPALHKTIFEWDGTAPGIDFVSSGKPIGLFALSHTMAIALAAESKSSVISLQDLHDWMENYACQNALNCPAEREVDDDSWQIIQHLNDRVTAECKLEHWLIKPTDGIFARFNRRLSIPFSRQLLKFPITPNIITLFTLVVSLVSGAFFALGGYWNCLLGAILSLWAGILDGNDGEIARMKMLTSDFGCWFDTVCDYLYYLVVFTCMPVGLMRSTGNSSFIGWGIAIIAGAILTFATTLFERKRLTHGHPEQYLATWQKKSEMRSAGLLVNIGRYTEFIVRRCFLPYLILLLALLNLTQVTVYMAAIGANVAWIISLRSMVVFSRKRPEEDESIPSDAFRDEISGRITAELSTSVSANRHL